MLRSAQEWKTLDLPGWDKWILLLFPSIHSRSIVVLYHRCIVTQAQTPCLHAHLQIATVHVKYRSLQVLSYISQVVIMDQWVYGGLLSGKSDSYKQCSISRVDSRLVFTPMPLSNSTPLYKGSWSRNHPKPLPLSWSNFLLDRGRFSMCLLFYSLNPFSMHNDSYQLTCFPEIVG